MADHTRKSRLRRSGVVWDALRQVLNGGSLREDTAAPMSALDIVDVGGGTGGFAVPLAELGHRLTVIDPSPDALAALERRARDAGVEVRAAQGEAGTLLQVVVESSADLVLCHGVLEQVDDVDAALSAVVDVLRPGAAASIVTANRNAVVLARAVAGRFAEAAHALDDPDGRWGDGDPLPRRFTEPQLVDLMRESGLDVGEVHGVRTFRDLVPGAMIDGDVDAHEELLALEAATADRPAFRAIAAQLHVLARRPRTPGAGTTA